MKKTTLEEFREELLATGAYHTADSHCREIRATPSAWTTLTFSLGIFHIFPMCMVSEPIGRLTTDRWAHYCFRTVQNAEKIGMRVHLEGWKQRQDYSGPVVYVCNHLSGTETILLPPILLSYGPFNVVTKASLAHLPFLENAAAHMGIVPIGRKSPREDLMKLLTVGCERIAQGNSFLIFPQGTRSPVFDQKHFSSIGAKLAERAGVPIVPIAVDTRSQLPRTKGLLKKVFHDFGPVDPTYDIRCACGPIIQAAKAREMHEKSYEWIATKLEEWGMPTKRHENLKTTKV